jgi:membrane fusion protein, multidrug efflux system
MTKPILLRAVFSLVVPAAAIALGGCAKPPLAPIKAAAPEVFVELPTVQRVTDYEDFTGRTEAFRVVDIRPEVTGKLKSILFKDGDFVAAGAPLFEIEDDLYKAAVLKAKADVEKTKADIVNWKAQIQLAKAELQRAEKAAEGSAAAQTDVDKARATLDVNKAQLTAAEASHDAAKAMEQTAHTMYGYTKISSQYDGRLSRRMVDPGNILKANETVLTRLLVLDPIYISFDVDERTVLMLRKLVASGKRTSARESRLDVLVGLADEEGYSNRAPITFADNQLDLNTGTLRVRAEMPNPTLQVGLSGGVGYAATVPSEQKSLRLLSPGMFVRVRMPVGREHPGILIPEEALGSDQGQRFVYVVNDKDEAVYRRVKLGPQEGKYRVIDEGIAPGERVIVSGLQRVRPNTKVIAKMKGHETGKSLGAVAAADNPLKK